MPTLCTSPYPFSLQPFPSQASQHLPYHPSTCFFLMHQTLSGVQHNIQTERRPPSFNVSDNHRHSDEDILVSRAGIPTLPTEATIKRLFHTQSFNEKRYPSPLI